MNFVNETFSDFQFFTKMFIPLKKGRGLNRNTNKRLNRIIRKSELRGRRNKRIQKSLAKPIQPKLQVPLSPSPQIPATPSGEVAGTKKKIIGIQSLGNNTVTIKDSKLIVQGQNKDEATDIARKIANGEAKLGNVCGKQVLVLLGGQEEADLAQPALEEPPYSPASSTLVDSTEDWECSFIHCLEVNTRFLEELNF